MAELVTSEEVVAGMVGMVQVDDDDDEDYGDDDHHCHHHHDVKEKEVIVTGTVGMVQVFMRMMTMVCSTKVSYWSSSSSSSHSPAS